MAVNPWFSQWNYHLLQIFFRWVPHTAFADKYCDLFILDPLLSTWIFAACFYRFWTKDDEQTARRRQCLVQAVVAFGVAVVVTLLLRPWIHWPAPVLNPNFQPLFPRYLWGDGSENCFPSHSTLAYFMIAAGFWPLHRRLSALLAAMAFCFVSLPRVYAGGHYPIDVLFSCVLGILTLVAVWTLPASFTDRTLPTEGNFQGVAWDLVFFLWVFELGEGFRGTGLLLRAAQRLLWRNLSF